MNSTHIAPASVVRCVLALGLLAAFGSAPAAGAGSTSSGPAWWWPLDPRPEVIKAYEQPATTYAAGHRGLDLGADPGAVVRAVDDGVVTFAGKVAGIAVVSVDHGGIRSTYQPVAATVSSGQRVGRGAPLGRLLVAGSHCHPRSCLHLGRRHGETYADPAELLGARTAIRLVTPYGPVPSPPPVRVGPLPSLGPGGLVLPVEAPISSPFGMRVHPVTGVLKLHDGTDFAAPCGTPAHAAAAGRVVGATYDPAYGNRVVIDHGAGTTTTYNHLSGFSVTPGQTVATAETLGSVGSTGLSTGCHLHFMVLQNGSPVDPMSTL